MCLWHSWISWEESGLTGAPFSCYAVECGRTFPVRLCRRCGRKQWRYEDYEGVWWDDTPPWERYQPSAASLEEALARLKEREKPPRPEIPLWAWALFALGVGMLSATALLLCSHLSLPSDKFLLALLVFGASHGVGFLIGQLAAKRREKR